VIARGLHGGNGSPYKRGVESRVMLREALKGAFVSAVDEDRGLPPYHLPETLKYSLKVLGR